MNHTLHSNFLYVALNRFFFALFMTIAVPFINGCAAPLGPPQPESFATMGPTSYEVFFNQDPSLTLSFKSKRHGANPCAHLDHEAYSPYNGAKFNVTLEICQTNNENTSVIGHLTMVSFQTKTFTHGDNVLHLPIRKTTFIQKFSSNSFNTENRLTFKDVNNNTVTLVRRF